MLDPALNEFNNSRQSGRLFFYRQHDGNEPTISFEINSPRSGKHANHSKAGYANQKRNILTCLISNVPDSIIANRAQKHITSFITIDSLINKGKTEQLF